MKEIHVELANYDKPEHQQAVVELLDHYARGEMGGNQGLTESVKCALVAELKAIPGAFSILAFDKQVAVGLVNCFMAFSTFKCQPIVNIHDIVVHEDARGQGVSLKLLKVVDEVAKARGCCKVTLEVLEKNVIAKGAYRKHGFSSYELDPKQGRAEFWEKVL